MKSKRNPQSQNFLMRGIMLAIVLGLLSLPLLMCGGIFFLQDAMDDAFLDEDERDFTYEPESEIMATGVPVSSAGLLDDKTAPPDVPGDSGVFAYTLFGSETDGDMATSEDSEILLAMPDTDGTVDDREYTRLDSTVASSIAAAPVIPVAPLQAGEIDDNVKWDDYMQYYRETLELYCDSKSGYTATCRDFAREVEVSGRNILTVVDAAGLPVPGATVEIFADENPVVSSRTYADGRTLYFPNQFSFDAPPEQFTAIATKDDDSAEIILENGRVLHDIVLEDVSIERDAVTLDVMFLIDATGSMSDEIAQLQQNILAISSQIDALPGDVNARYGLVAYRDRGDDYVTQVYEFTPDVKAFQRDLNTVVADGGGDTPEALNEGLHDALTKVEWRGEDTIKLMFLVSDAPPQLSYRDDVDYDLSILDALERGIKIHTLASSGLDPQGEFIFRQISQVTMGHFLFLTYEGSVPGTPGEDREDLEVGDPEDEQGVGDYSVEQLDELVLQLITDEIAAYRGETTEE